MASTRALLRLSLRSALPAVSHQQCLLRQASVASPLHKTITHPFAVCHAVQQVRWRTTILDTGSTGYCFEDIKKLIKSPSSERILIDVREPNEYNAGFIPTAINLPVKSQPTALSLAPDLFERRYGFSKPPLDKELIFYCLAGVRSMNAAELARHQGYKKVSEYRGSWSDWERRGGEISPGPKGQPGGDSTT